ncbi:MAG: D-arabinose 5-phosphate isomerase [Deltaproteobacteria bacterium DG_8]|nr:MAG: D-arabinose 5-phosphate isomerase [Deltaproteobacteria bacterium DG_8]
MNKSNYSKGREAVINQAKRVLTIEAKAIRTLLEKINDNFTKAVDLLDQCKGKVIVIGIGKSGIISQKIASTFACTGTPAFFLHPAEGIHGDIGMMSKEDVVLAISNSGETKEIIQLLPLIKRWGIKLIVITGKPNSVLAHSGDVILDTGVKEEACPLGLVPTASTTATLAMGDALALALLEKKGFREDDFAILHPGGTLGRKLLLRVEDLMHKGDEIPLIQEDTLMKEGLLEMTSKRLGVTGICDKEGKLVGIITDGDLRRALEREDDLLNKKASKIMTKNPKSIAKDDLAAKALHKMEEFSITSLFILAEDGSYKPIGIIHMHDLLKAGVV